MKSSSADLHTPQQATYGVAMATVDVVAIDHRWQWNPNLWNPHQPLQLMSVQHTIRVPLQNLDQLLRVFG